MEGIEALKITVDNNTALCGGGIASYEVSDLLGEVCEVLAHSSSWSHLHS